MNIYIEAIPHERQRYETVGDWWFDENGLQIRVSHTTDDNDFLIAIHEAIEAWLCTKRGISEQRVTEFDLGFEANRLPGNEEEPGDSPLSPYFNEHQFATNIERQIAEELFWTNYENTINSLHK